MFNSKDLNNTYSRVRRTNQKQKHILFAAMAVNRHILEYRAGVASLRRLRRDSWKQLVAQLNSVGHQKDVAQWRKCWTDLRLAMRKKYEKAQQNKHILTEYERRVINACGMVDYVGEDVKETEDVNGFIQFLEQEKFNEEIREKYEHPDEEITSDPKLSSFYESESKSYEHKTVIKQEFDEKSSDVYIRESSVDISCDEKESIEHLFTCDSKQPVTVQPEDHKSVASEVLTLLSDCSEEMEIVPSSKDEITSTRIQEKDSESATLTEIRKMHRNMLKESKKQTALLRKLISLLER